MIEYQTNNGELIIDGVNIPELAKEYGTPLYVISYTELKNKIKEFQESFLHKYDNVAIRYASKANLSTGLAKIMDHAGFGLDVVSGGEVFIAQHANVDMAEVEFNGNNKTPREIKEAMNAGVGYFVCDNITELALINKIAGEQGIKQQILFRITPDVSDGAHKYINTGQLDSKFGIPLADGIFFDVLKGSLELPNIEVKGLHFHIGSQFHDNAGYLRALEVVEELCAVVQAELGLEIDILNIGGGFGIWYTESDTPPSLSYYFEPIMEKIENIFSGLSYAKRPRIVIEPGRYMIGEPGFTLYTLGSISEVPGIRTYVGIDGGMCDNIRPALYQAKYHAVVANKMDTTETQEVTIAGNCCESGDILIEDIELPPIESDDILCVFSTGAYNYSMASNYNKNLIPPTVLIENGKVQMLVKGQTYEQLVMNDCEIEI